MSQTPNEFQSPDTIPARWANAPRVQPGSPAFTYLTGGMGFTPGLIETLTARDALREGPGGTAWLPQRGSDGAITGISVLARRGNEGPDEHVVKGEASLFRFSGSGEGTGMATRVVLTDDPRGALRMAQTEGIRPDTLYVTASPTLPAASADPLRAEIRKIADLPGAELVIATGDPALRQMAVAIAQDAVVQVQTIERETTPRAGANAATTGDAAITGDPQAPRSRPPFPTPQEAPPAMSQTQTEEDPQQNLPPAISTRWTRSTTVKPGSPVFKYLNETLGIAPAVIDAATRSDALREGPGGTAWFPNRDADGGITGVSIDSRDIANRMLRGSQKTLFRLGAGDADAPPTRIMMTEFPIEALAIAHIEKVRPDTLYVATAGSLSAGSSAALAEELKKIAGQPDAELGIATNRGAQGEMAAQYAAKLAEDAGVPIVRYASPERTYTWNAYLKANPDAERLPRAPTPSAGASSDTSSTSANDTAPSAPKAPDQLVELLNQMKAVAASSNAEEMAGIKGRIEKLLVTGQATPDRLREPILQMRIGWALMDVEKNTGQRIDLPDEQRKAIRIAGETMPGLTNQDVRAELVATKNILDQNLVDQIRNFASFVAAEPYPQMTSEINAKVIEIGRSVIASLGSQNARETEQSIDRSVTGTAAKSTQETAQSTHQTAQSTQQTAASANQRSTQAETGAEVNDATKTDVKTGKEQPVVQAAGGLPATVHQPGNFLERLNGIALAWHERFQGEGSIHRKLLAQQAEEMRARGETPPPMPPIPPAPNFTAPREPNPSPPAATTKPGADAAQPTTSGIPSAQAQTSPTPPPAPTPTPAVSPNRSPFIDFTHEVIFGNKGPEGPNIARADATAPWPKTSDSSLAGSIGTVGTDSSQNRIAATVDRAIESGKEAATAVNDLLTGPGREIMGRVTAAARGEGGNITAVIEGMRPDGKYAGLRQDFDKAVQENPALNAAIDNAVAKLNTYGEYRAGVDTAYRKFDLDPKQAEALFKNQDQTLAEAAESFPGKKPGTSLFADLAQVAREAIQAVAALLRQVIGMNPGPTTQPTQDNSPSMGM